MHFSTTKDQLISGVNTVIKAASSKNAMEVLKGIKIEVIDSTLTYSATNLEIGIQTKQSLIDCSNGVVVVPAKLFSNIVCKLPNSATITCAQKENMLEIIYGDSSIQITTFDAEEFPLMPDVLGETIKINSGLLKFALSKVRPAIANETNRPVFSGVYFNLQEEKFDIVGTDTHRLALMEITLEGNQEKMTAIIPGPAVDELLRLPDNDLVTMKRQGGQIVFETEDTKIFTRQIDGTFPNYRQVIPKDWESRVKIRPKELIGVIDRASILTDNKIITLIDGLRIKSSDIKGNISEHYDVATEGKPIKIAFNAAFMIDALKCLHEEEVEMRFTGESVPITLKENGYTHIVLPVRVTR